MIDKTEEVLYLTAEQTIWLIPEVRNNVIGTILGKVDLMELNTKEVIPKLKSIREMDSKHTKG